LGQSIWYIYSKGGEQYLTIGNFRDGMSVNKQFIARNFTNVCGIGNAQNASYIYIDDVSLYEIPTPQLQSNAITICPNADTLVLGDTARIQTRYQWFANGIAIDTTSFIKVKPNTNNHLYFAKHKLHNHFANYCCNI